MANLTNKQKKELAYMIYIHEQLTQKEIAAKVQVSEKTMSDWVRKGEWEMKKASLTMTRDQILRDLYFQTAEMNRIILSRPVGERYATPSEADTMCKNAKTIDSLERELNIGEAMLLSREIVNYVRSIDPDKAKELSYFFESYITSKMP